MSRAPLSLLLPFLAITAMAIAGCGTQRKPLTGFDKPPPGIILDWNTGSALVLWPIFDLPVDPQRIFRPRLNDQDVVVVTSDEGFYDYAAIYLQGWTAGWSQPIGGVPPGTYTVELIDEAGQSWGKSAPLPIPAGAGSLNSSVQAPGVVFAHFGAHNGTWTIDPTMQDADTTTDEITVTNLADEDVIVERCLIAAGIRTACTAVAAVAPLAELRTVETPMVVPSTVVPSTFDHQALFIHLANDPGQSYQRDLVLGDPGTSPNVCQIERIIVHGKRSVGGGGVQAFSEFAMSSCYGYASGPAL